MNTALIIDEHSELKEIRKKEFPKQPLFIRIIAKVLSYIFHPVFVPVFVLYFLLYIHPYMFAGYSNINKLLVFAQGFMMLSFFPLITVLLLKGLKFIDSVYLYTQKDRVIPFIACMTWYFWLWYVWNNMGKNNDSAVMPPETVEFALAIFISTIIGLMANIKMKISLHAIAMGVMLCFIIQMAFSQGLNYGIYISVALLIAGLVCTSRFILTDHSQREVYGGLAAGILSMLIAHLVG